MSQPLRIGVLAEGETELGKSVPYIQPQEGGKPINPEHEGALHTLIRRELAQVGINDCEFIQRRPSIKESKRNTVRTGYSIGDPKYLKQIVVAWSGEVDLVIILLDADEDVAKRRAEIEKALAAIRVSHFRNDDELIENQSAGGLAIRNFEAWLLADPENFTELFGVELAELPVDIEDLPADSGDPLFSKNIFDTALQSSDFRPELTPNNREMAARWELAKVIDLVAIKTRCPYGYNHFVNDLLAAAAYARPAA